MRTRSRGRTFHVLVAACLGAGLLAFCTHVGADKTVARRTPAGPWAPPVLTDAERNAQVRLETLLDAAATMVGRDHFAGAWRGADGVTNFAVTKGTPIPPDLLNDPEVRIVTVRSSLAKIEAAMSAVLHKLNRLLALGLDPHRVVSPWPWEARVNSQKNVVEITVGTAYKSRRAEIETALAPELRSGIARIRYGRVAAVAVNA